MEVSGAEQKHKYPCNQCQQHRRRALSSYSAMLSNRPIERVESATCARCLTWGTKYTTGSRFRGHLLSPPVVAGGSLFSRKGYHGSLR